MILNELLQRQRKNNEARIHLHCPSPAARGASCKSKQAFFKRCKEVTKTPANVLASSSWGDLSFITYRAIKEMIIFMRCSHTCKNTEWVVVGREKNIFFI
ncbi:hypothetical protein ILYODFUR_004366 [Ilyodon furcidens]|uniref:Uncharacterized protein n=1 Tax=Ilyodon furcidens TaxID=33524 RepID=A0ABV0U2L9_9TELE